jgi:hypothetical protein
MHLRIRSCGEPQPAPAKADCRRETPVLLRRGDGSLVEGIVDLAFCEDTSDFVGWTIVDFKTDRKVEAMSGFIAQVKVYSEARGDRFACARHHSGVLMLVSKWLEGSNRLSRFVFVLCSLHESAQKCSLGFSPQLPEGLLDRFSPSRGEKLKASVSMRAIP